MHQYSEVRTSKEHWTALACTECRLTRGSSQTETEKKEQMQRARHSFQFKTKKNKTSLLGEGGQKVKVGSVLIKMRSQASCSHHVDSSCAIRRQTSQ